MATRILILYHSSRFEKRPGADEYIYTTAKTLSEADIVNVITWGEGESKTVNERNLTITHFGNGRKKHNLVNRGKHLGFLIDTLAYLGFHYIIFLQRKKGPSVSNVLDLITYIYNLFYTLHSLAIIFTYSMETCK
jgi:hypothetical protein